MTPSSPDAISMMSTDREAAIIAGVVFIVATAAVLASTPFLPDLATSDYLAGFARNPYLVDCGVLLLFVAAFGSAGIAVAMYPVMRKANVALALASVVFRTMEAVLYIVAAMCLLALLTLSRQFSGAGEADRAVLQSMADLLRSGREHSVLAGVFCFCLGALCYYVLFFQSRQIPRWLSGFGIVAIILMFVACLLALFSDTAVSGYVPLALPIAVQEMVMAVWLIVKGFDSTVASPAALVS